MKKILLTILIIIILVLGWYLISPIWRVKVVNDVSPVQQINTKETATTTVKIIAQGNFIAHAHTVNGVALLIEQEGKKTLRFENFETVNGPDVRIYLSKDLTNKDYIDISSLKATKGNVNYEIPASVDTSKYNNVLVWCRAFSVLFSSATLETK